jgi:NADH-quinone oxidoreductase subunit L
MFDLAWLLFAFPAAGALIILLLGPRLPLKAVGWIASLAVLAAFVVAAMLYVSLGRLPEEEREITITYWRWMTVGAFNVDAAILIDPLSATMAMVVTGIGALIHIYSIGYMAHEERYQRFFFYLNFFILAMLVLVMSNNFLSTFVGWEGVGLASYLLIGFWFEQRDEQYGWYADAGKKAFLVNRIGDAAYLVAMFILWTATGTLVYSSVEAQAVNIPQPTLVFVTLLLIFAVSGKSAQFPLYVWLPDAMAGPTPVSALIHAATMVTAGVYLLVRTFTIWDLAIGVATTLGYIGILTALFAATLALVQVDLKKILAYSTISQLGFMVAAAAVGSPGAAIFILVAHAFFKALLFLAAGSVMHATNGVIDIRHLGGLRHKMPQTYILFLIGAMALAGIPLMSGFWAKDAVLASIANEDAWIIYIIGDITALMTAIYSFRAVFMTFNGKPRDQHVYDHAHESPMLMLAPMWVLAFFSIFVGLANTPFSLTLEHFLEPSTGAHEKIGIALEIFVIMVSTVIALSGLFYAWARYIKREGWTVKLVEPLRIFDKPLAKKWYIDIIYDRFIVRPILAVSGWFARFFDPKVIDGAVNAVGEVAQDGGEAVRKLQNGAVPTYAFSIFLGVVVVVLYFVFAH